MTNLNKMFNKYKTYGQIIEETNSAEPKHRVSIAARHLYDRIYGWHIEPIKNLDNNAGFIILNECFFLLDQLTHLKQGSLTIAHYGRQRIVSFLKEVTDDLVLANSIYWLMDSYFSYGVLPSGFGVSCDLKTKWEADGLCVTSSACYYDKLIINPKLLIDKIDEWFKHFLLRDFGIDQDCLLKFYIHLGVFPAEDTRENIMSIDWPFHHKTWAEQHGIEKVRENK